MRGLERATGRSSEPLAFEHLYLTYARDISGFVHRRVKDRHLADDVVQEVFIRAWRARGTIDPARPVWPFLRTIATHAIADALRVHPSRYETLAGEPKELSPVGLATTVDEMLVGKDEIRDILCRLSPRHQRVLVLRHLDGRSHEEIAEAEGVSSKAVKSLLNRAKHAFRAAYDEHGRGLPTLVPLSIRPGRLKGFLARRQRALDSFRAIEGLQSAYSAFAGGAVAVVATLALVSGGSPAVDDGTFSGPGSSDRIVHNTSRAAPHTARKPEDRIRFPNESMPRESELDVSSDLRFSDFSATLDGEVDRQDDEVSARDEVNVALPEGLGLESEGGIRFSCGNEARRPVCDTLAPEREHPS